MTPTNPNYLPKASFENTITLRFQALIYEFWRAQILSTQVLHLYVHIHLFENPSVEQEPHKPKAFFQKCIFW